MEQVAAAAALLAEPARAAMIVALLDGRALPAGELARIAGIGRPAASAHLAKLTASGLLAVAQQGRHRYYRLADPRVAHAVESLGAIIKDVPVRSLRQSLERERLAHARTCYDHLAGALAVRFVDALVTRSDAERGDAFLRITESGTAFFTRLGIDVRDLCGPTRVTRTCIDWTERRQHISGPLGRALLRSLIERGCLAHRSEPRAVQLTESGKRVFEQLLSTEPVGTPSEQLQKLA